MESIYLLKCLLFGFILRGQGWLPVSNRLPRRPTSWLGLGSSTGWASLTISELKAELRARGLRVSGRKLELIERLEADDALQIAPDSLFTDIENMGVDYTGHSENRKGAAEVQEPKQQRVAGKRMSQDFIEMEQGGPMPEAAYSTARGIEDGMRREEVLLERGVTVAAAAKMRERLGMSLVEALATGVLSDDTDDDKEDIDGNPDEVPYCENFEDSAVFEQDDFEDAKAEIVESESAQQPSTREGEHKHAALLPGVQCYVVATPQALQPWHPMHHGAGIRPVLLLPDNDGWQSSAVRSMADHIAFVCNTVVAVPDLRNASADAMAGDLGTPTDDTLPTLSSLSPPRPLHTSSTLRDVRTCCRALLRDYNGTALGLVGVGTGGGVALEAALSGYAGHSTARAPARGPRVVVAMYPTCYHLGLHNAYGGVGGDTSISTDPKDAATTSQQTLTGNSPPVRMQPPLGSLCCPCLAIFGALDELPGATPSDAAALKELLQAQSRYLHIRGVSNGGNPSNSGGFKVTKSHDNDLFDFQVLSFSGQGHGFIHKTMMEEAKDRDNDGEGSAPLPWKVHQDAEDAMLMTTAWLDLYNRPKHMDTKATAGPLVSDSH